MPQYWWEPDPFHYLKSCSWQDNNWPWSKIPFKMFCSSWTWNQVCIYWKYRISEWAEFQLWKFLHLQKLAALGRTITDSEVFDEINIEIEAHEKMFNMVCWFNPGWSMVFVICGQSNNFEVGILDLELVKPCHEKVSVYCFL